MATGRPAPAGGRLGTAPIDRRRFLRGAGTVGVGAALAGSLPRLASAAAREQRGKTVVVYRLSTRGMDACQACKAHGAHLYFRTHRVHRAHKGCNCRKLKQRIKQKTWNRYFVRHDGSLRNKFDDRQEGG
jgi:hypothetical protein